MMRKLAKLAVLAVLFVPALASAQVSLGARLGYAFPMGDVAEGGSLGDTFSSQIPLQIDVGFKVTPAVTLGGYFSYGIAQVDSACGDCSGRVYRAGVEVDYTFKSKSMTPWVGAGIGYEWVKISGDFDGKMSGFEFLNLQGGVDWKVGGKFFVGPFAGLNIGQYSTADGNDISNKAFHEWLQLGIRGRFDL